MTMNGSCRVSIACNASRCTWVERSTGTN